MATSSALGAFSIPVKMTVKTCATEWIMAASVPGNPVWKPEFRLLAPEARAFWLRLSEGLDSFSYSSRALNPLFRVLGWGGPLLNLVAVAEVQRDGGTESILETYPFFKTTLQARANAYLLKALIDSEHVELLRNVRFRSRFEEFSHRLSKQLSLETLSSSAAPYVHLLPMTADFLDFLRLSARIVRATEEEAASLKEFTDRELAQFREELYLFLT